MTGLRKFLQTYAIGLIVLVVAIVLSLMTPQFFRVENLFNVMTNAAVVAVVGVGMTLAIASGNFDLSVGSTAAFAGCISMSLVPTVGVAAGIAAGLLTGALVGLVNGLIITELRVPAFIATLGMLEIVRGLALIYTQGHDIYLYGQTEYKVLSGGHILGIPMPVLIAIGLAAVMSVVVAQTRFGRHVLAIGNSLPAARRSGVRTSQVLWGVFAIVGAAAALSGMIISAQVLTANGRLATGLELSAIAVVVVGGTSLSGGRASMLGTLLGAILVAVINNGLNLLNVPIYYQELTVGILLVVALALSVDRSFNPFTQLRRQQ
jgi:ribose/xylose/arabinose/galactoside ABC-type transport system permease subunit